MTSSNELGFTPIFDGAVPRTITGKARQDISGGQFVVISGTGDNVVSSGVNTFAANDLEFALVVSGTASHGSKGIDQINGIATDDILSGAFGTIATRCTALVKCGSNVIEGTKIVALDRHSIATIGSVQLNDIIAGGQAGVPESRAIGRAITAGLSGTNLYAIASFDF